MANFKEIINYFEVFSDNHTQNNGYGWGNISELNTNNMGFPLIFVNPTSSSINNNVTTFSYEVYFLDVLLQDNSNLKDVMSNTTQIGNDFISFFTDNSESTGFELDETTVNISPFAGKFDEFLGGWIFSFDIETVMSLGCNLPLTINQPIGPGTQEVVFGSGTTNYLTKWEDENTLTDSLISESGNTISIHGDLYILNDIIDSSNNSGETNQVLSVTDSGVTWVDLDSGSVEYFNEDPVPEELGGIEVGRTFPSGTTMQDVLTDLLYPFQVPSFSSFNIATLGGTTDIGKFINGTNLNSTWGTTHSNNIKSNTVEISGYNLTTINNLENDGSEILNIISFVGLSTKTWTIKAENTHNTIFSRNLSMKFYNRRYWGSSAFNVNTFAALTDTEKDAEIFSLDGASVGSGSELTTSRVKTYNGINGAGEYLMFAFPLSFGTPSFTVNGLPNSAFTKTDYSFTNSEGYINTYQVWFSNTAQSGALALFAIK